MKNDVEQAQYGTLYIVATPIGNLEDMSFRAIRTLNDVDLIAAEDTRHTIKLLNHYNIQKPLTSYYEHNKTVKGNYLIEQLINGKSIAITSDAGMPGISDPGEDIIGLAIANNIKVSVIPGPSAVIAGVVVSGLPSGRFVFEGFLPFKKKQRVQRLDLLKNETRTMVFYEAPHKLKNTLKDFREVLGNRKISLARELTKKYEEVIRCRLDEAIQLYEENTPRGEYVVIVDGKDYEELKNEKEREWENMSIKEHLELYISQGFCKNDAMKQVASDRGVKKRQVYDACLREKKDC